MQRKLKSYTIIASLAASLAIVFIACGSGEITEYLVVELNNSKENFSGKCFANGKPQPECVGDLDSIPSSSSVPPPPSSETTKSSQGGGTSSQGGGTSSQGGGTSSQGGGTSSQGGGTSSVTPQPKSSSSAAPSGNCPSGNAKPGYECAWDFKGSLVPAATTIKPEKTGDDAGCTTKWWNKPSQLLNKCNEVPSEGIPAEGGRIYTLYAELDCGGTKYANACKPTDGLKAGAAPELTDACKWAKNPTTTARGGSPSGVGVKDDANLCADTKVKYVYETADGLKDWPATGTLPEWKSWDKKHKETYDVKATFANCPKYTIPTYSDCPPLEVNAGTDYIIECTGKFDDKSCKVNTTVGNSVILNTDECAEINVVGYTDQYNLPTVIMRCETQGTTASASVTISFNGTDITASGSYSVQPIVTLGKIKLGDNEFGTLCVKALSGATGLKCTGPSQ